MSQAENTEQNDLRGPDGAAIAVTVDAKGLNCPMPLLKMKMALNSLTSGQIVYLISTDKGSLRDVPSFAKQAGHEINVEVQETEYHFWLRKK